MILENSRTNRVSSCSTLSLIEVSREAYADEEGSLSGSMISLAHSNSSTSFPAGSL